MGLNGMSDTYVLQQETEVRNSLQSYFEAFVLAELGANSGVTVVSVSLTRNSGRQRRSLTDSWTVTAEMSAVGSSGRNVLNSVTTYYNDASNVGTIGNEIES